MQIRHLEVFHAIMLAGSVSAAARLLNISQPAATRLLLRAEDELGYKLFARVKGRLIATSEARILHVESGRVLTGLENLRKLSRNLGSSRTGHLRIAAAPALCVDLIPVAITKLRKSHPRASFSVEARQYSDLLRVVVTHDVDIGFGFNAQPHPGLDITPFAQGRFYGIFPAALSARLPNTVNAGVFKRHPYIGLGSEDPLGPTSSARLNAALKVIGLDLRPIVEVKSNQIALSLVQRGAGVAIVDQYTAATCDAARVVVRRLGFHVPFAVHSMRARNHPTSVLAKDFVTVLAQTEKEISRQLPS
jgi:DNA-binding transcriptional LysR family regulator